MTLINTRKILVFLLCVFISSNVLAQAPVADFTVDDADGCAPHTANFNSTSTGPSLSFSWNFHDPNSPGTSNSQNPSHIFAFSGQYSVTLTVSNTNGIDSISKTITVFTGPTAAYTISTDTVCSGQSVTFNDASIPGDAPITQWSWTFNDGSPPDLSSGNVTHVFTNFSSQIESHLAVYKPTDSNGCNSIASSDSIYVYPEATASFNVNITSCSLPFIVDFTNASSGPAIFSWDFNDPASGANNTSTLATPSHTYNTAGSYLVTLTNGYPGCTAQDTMTITVAPPIAEFSVDDSIICKNDIMTFTNLSTPTPLNSMTYRWDFGDFTPFNFAINPTHLYTAPGFHVVKLTATLGGCSNTVTHTIYVANPSVAFSTTDRFSCKVPFDVTFTDTSSLNKFWEWDFGDPGSGSNTSNDRNPTHTYNNFGSYTIKLIVTDIFDCQDSITLFDYIIVEEPQFDFSVQDSGCVPVTINYLASSNPIIDNSTIVDYTWNFGDGSPPESGPNPNTSHVFDSVGVFNVGLTVTTTTGCTATIIKSGYARAGTRPNATIDEVYDTICFKESISFNDLTPPPVTGWHWYFGEGEAYEQNPTHKYEMDTSGVVDPYDIILIAYYNGCADSDTVVNMIAVKGPIPFFLVDYDCTNPDSVVFTDQSGFLTGKADSIFWNFGDGSPIDTGHANPYHIYTVSGNYNVTLTAKNIADSCTIDTIIPVEIRFITAVANSDFIELCHPATYLFTGSGSQDAVDWLWDFDDGTTATTPDTTHLYNVAGYYTATLTTMDLHGCIAVDTQRVHVLGPTANFTADTLGGCSPLFVTFKDSSQTEGSGISTWIWDYGTQEPNDTLTIDSVTHVFNSAGLYSVTLITIDSNGCADRYTKLNFINPTKPLAGIFIPDTGCARTPEVFIGSPGPPGSFALPVTYIWNFGDSQTLSDSTTNQAFHSYAANGNYHVELKVVDANGCRDSITDDIFVHTTSANFTYSTTSDCVVDLDGIKKANVNAIFTCTSTDFITLSKSIFDWDFTVDHFPVTHLSTYNYNYYNVPPGSYDVTLILTNDLGCRDTITAPGAIIVPGPIGSFTFSPDSGCSPLTVNFVGSGTNTQLFSWDFGDGNVIIGTNDSIVSHTYTAVGTHEPQFLLGFDLSTETCYIPVPGAGDVQVTSQVGVNIVEPRITVPPGGADTLTVNVTNGLPPFQYNWNPADHVVNGPTSNTFLASIEKDSAYYYVNVPYGTAGCSGYDSVLVVYLIDECEQKFKPDSIPNVFTPDGNSLNDFYYIKNLCASDKFKITIYNRWGRIIYESTDINFHWDGTTSSGTEVAEGVYYYILNTKSSDYRGYIDLIRSKK